MQSCTIEKKLGKEFLSKAPQICIDLHAPQALYKYNHKGEKIPGFDSMTGPQQDSSLVASSNFIRNIDDSSFLDRYVNSFIDELRGIGFTVFLDGNVDTILRVQPQAYIVSMAQVQLDEYFSPYEDSEPIGDSVFYKSFDLNAVDASSWFEVNKYNAVRPKKTVLYSSFTASDGFNGNFIYNDMAGTLRYRYRIDSLKVKDIYDLAAYAGRQNADYLFDFFMNQYIVYHMPQDMEILGYLHYNSSRKTFEFSDQDKFEVQQPK
jgi:hypothetical protein